MPFGKATTKTIEVQYFTFELPEDFSKALEFLARRSWQGGINAHTQRNPETGKDETLWGLMVVAPDASQTGPVVIGETLVWNGRTLEVMPTAEFVEKYDVM